DGRLSIIAFLTGAKAELMLARFMVKRQTMTASTLRAQSDAAKAAIAAELREKVWPLFASSKVKPIIDSVLPLSKAAKAHERIESSTHIGKIILQIGST
ncbi:MAG: zinc-binding dehydrogenase, partial [Alphaproteobacteria bacterium]|nr:zinc-binding dehydrogenase [Alphaproteobacteria bacterium]